MAKLMKNLLPLQTKITIIHNQLRQIAEETLFCNGTRGINGYVQSIHWCLDVSDMTVTGAELGGNSFLQDNSATLFYTKPEELDFLIDGVLTYDDDGEYIPVDDNAEDFISRTTDGIDLYATMEKCFDWLWSSSLSDDWKDKIEFELVVKQLDDEHEPTHTYLPSLQVDEIEEIMNQYDEVSYNVINDDGTIVVYTDAPVELGGAE